MNCPAKSFATPKRQARTDEQHAHLEFRGALKSGKLKANAEVAECASGVLAVHKKGKARRQLHGYAVSP